MLGGRLVIAVNVLFAEVGYFLRLAKGNKQPNKRTTTAHDLQEFSVFSGLSIRARMSSTRQAVILGPNLTGCGNRFDLTPAHQVLFDTGIGPYGSNDILEPNEPGFWKTEFRCRQFRSGNRSVSKQYVHSVLLAFSISFQICIAGRRWQLPAFRTRTGNPALK